MAINVPAKFQVIPQSKLFSPIMAVSPLQKILENANFLYQYHSPAVVSVAPSQFAVGRLSEYHIPALPSADGLRYNFELRHVFSAASQAFTVTVDYTTSYQYGATAWTNLYATAYTSSATAGGLTVVQQNSIALPANLTVLRFRITAPAAGNRRDHHFLVYPAVSGLVAGVQPSGFAPVDDGLFSGVSAVHTEWLNRAKQNVGAIVSDRKPMCFSFAQEVGAVMHSYGGDNWTTLPPVRAYFPGQKKVEINFRAIASVSAGAGTYRMRIGTPGGSSTYLSALVTGEDTQTATFECVGTGNQAHVDLQLWCRATAGNTLYPTAITGHWLP